LLFLELIAHERLEQIENLFLLPTRLKTGARN